MNESNFSSLDEIRTNIDKIDKEIVTLLSKRGDCVKQAARFKESVANVKDSQRLEQIIQKVTSYAKDIGFDPLTIEIIYRNMVDAFIQLEMKTYTNLRESAESHTDMKYE
ncbi:MAG: chorismate mutase [Thermoproteota archaeon]|nr:chorismate mutase [Thermoproteota archaeon]